MKKYANIYKILCNQANNVIRNKYKKEDLPDGWEVVNKEFNPHSNFKGVLYKNKDNQYALTFVGTDKKSIKDWGANLKMGLTGTSRQIEQAKKFAKRMSKEYELTSNNTVSLGHSEGGTEATIVGLENGLKTTTFNPYGIWESKYGDEKYDHSLVTNYRDPHDPISKLHKNVGKTYIVPNTQNKFMSKTPFGIIQAHGLENMGNVEQSIPKDEYKKNNKWFIDKISDVDISREDIALFEPELFALYENEINQRMINNQIKLYSQFNIAKMLNRAYL